MSFFTKIFSWISKLLSKLFDLVKKILPIVLLAAAVWLGLGFGIPVAWLVAGALPLEGAGAALLLAGSSFLVAPGETSEVLSKAVGAVGDVASDVASTIVDVASSAAGALLSSPIGIAALVIGGLWLFGGKSDRKENVPVFSPPGVAP